METLLEEGKEFVKIKRSYDSERFPSAGTAGYLISTQWLRMYREYIFYDDLRYNMKPKDVSSNHLTKKHPGEIKNVPLLHSEAKYLKGTGEINDFEADVVDKYIHKDTRERSHFEIINEEIWKFLSDRYGTDTTIKRYYINKGSGYFQNSELDCRLELIPVFIVTAEDLYGGRVAD